MIAELTWDSNLFGFKVGSFYLNRNKYPIESVLKSARENKFKLIYLFSDEKLSQEFLFLADIKTTFSKKPSFHNLTSIKEYSNNIPSKDLYKLAEASGQFSRFFNDPKIDINKAKELYKIWIKKSVAGISAKKVFVKISDGKEVGFITLNEIKNIGSIGLIAVDENYRGQEIGKSLVKHADNFAYTSKFSELEVVTQGINVSAIKLYTSCGFSLKSNIYIYHLWL